MFPRKSPDATCASLLLPHDVVTPFLPLAPLVCVSSRSAARIAFRRALVTLALLLIARTTPASAQLVGSNPTRSPFRDLETNQQLTFSAGWLAAANDAANVGPDAAPFFSLRHDIHMAGPAWLTTRYGFMRSERRVIDPGLPTAEREQGVQSVTHHVADIGVMLALTGQKSWHSMVPTFGGGIGLTSDFAGTDIGGYDFGTKFAFTFGPGLRIPLARGYSLRLDLTNNVYQFQYPSTYFIAASDSTSVLTDTRQRSGWLSNWSFTTGLSIPLFR